MVRHQQSNGALNGVGVDSLTRNQQQRLIEVMQVRLVGIEKALLNGCQRDLTCDDSLPDGDGRGLALRFGGSQRGDCLVMEELFEREVQTGAADTRYDLDAEDRVTAQFKKVVMCTYLLNP